MTVKAFFSMMESPYNVKVDLYEINENVEKITTSDEIIADDGLHEEWKNAEVQNWCVMNEDYMVLSVIK